MKTQFFTASSLDGFIATEDDSLDWLFPLGDVNDSSYPEFIAQVGAIAMGSSTYEWMLRNADTVAAQVGSPWPYTQPTWVFSSRTLPVIPGADLRFVNGDVRAVHGAMREAAGSKNLWIVGGGDLYFNASSFYSGSATAWGGDANKAYINFTSLLTGSLGLQNGILLTFCGGYLVA